MGKKLSLKNYTFWEYKSPLTRNIRWLFVVFLAVPFWCVLLGLGAFTCPFRPADVRGARPSTPGHSGRGQAEVSWLGQTQETTVCFIFWSLRPVTIRWYHFYSFRFAFPMFPYHQWARHFDELFTSKPGYTVRNHEIRNRISENCGESTWRWLPDVSSPSFVVCQTLCYPEDTRFLYTRRLCISPHKAFSCDSESMYKDV